MKGGQTIRHEERKQDRQGYSERTHSSWELTAKAEIESIFVLEISTWINTFVGLVSPETVPKRALEVWPSPARLLWLLWVLLILFKAAKCSFLFKGLPNNLLVTQRFPSCRPSLNQEARLFSKLFNIPNWLPNTVINEPLISKQQLCSVLLKGSLTQTVTLQRSAVSCSRKSTPWLVAHAGTTEQSLFVPIPFPPSWLIFNWS